MPYSSSGTGAASPSPHTPRCHSRCECQSRRACRILKSGFQNLPSPRLPPALSQPYPGADGIFGGEQQKEASGLWAMLPEGMAKFLSQGVRPVLLLKLIIKDGERVCSSVYHVAGPGLAHVWGIDKLWKRQRRGRRGASLAGAGSGLLSLSSAGQAGFYPGFSPPPPSKVPPFPLSGLSTRLTSFGGLPSQALMRHTLALAVLLGAQHVAGTPPL